MAANELEKSRKELAGNFTSSLHIISYTFLIYLNRQIDTSTSCFYPTVLIFALEFCFRRKNGLDTCIRMCSCVRKDNHLLLILNKY